MRNKSDMVLTGLMIAFFAFFIYRLPNAPTGDFQSNLTQNVNTFSSNVAADYNNAAGTIISTDGLTNIAPAAGDAGSGIQTLPPSPMQAATQSDDKAPGDKTDDKTVQPHVTQPPLDNTPVAQ